MTNKTFTFLQSADISQLFHQDRNHSFSDLGRAGMIMREIRFDIYFSLLLSILFIPSTFSYRTLHGWVQHYQLTPAIIHGILVEDDTHRCLTKPNMIAFGKDIDGPNGGSIEVS